ncbi:MAG: ABC transporter ATP-binding protein, partial [Breznakia sp.]
EDTMQHISIFMEDKEFEEVKNKFQFIAKKDINNDVLPYRIDMDKLQDESGIYVLENLKKSTLEALDKQIQFPILMVSGIDSVAKGNATLGGDEQSQQLKAFLEQIPKGMDVFTFLSAMPKENALEILNTSKENFASYGDSAVTVATTSAVRNEYMQLGVDMDSVQTNYIVGIGLKMLGIALLGGVASIIVSFLSSILSAKVGQNMRKDVFEKVESFSSSEMNKFSTASLITRTTNDVQQVQQSLVMILRIVIYSPILALGALVKVMDSSGAMLAIIATVVGILLVLIAITFAVLNPNFKKAQKILDKINLVMRENLSGMLVVRAFHNEDVEEKRFDDVNKDSLKVGLRIGRTFSLLIPVVMFIMNVVALLIVWVGSHEVDAGTIQIGEMMAFIQYAMQIIMSFMMIAMVTIMLSRSSVASKRIFEVLKTNLNIADPKNATAFDENKRGYIEFKNVSFRYPGAEEDVLSDLSFTAKPKETTAFVGSTGSGKSTIINLVPRFFDVSKGAVLVEGVDIREVSQYDLHEKIGYVPQQGQLFSGTIETNIKYADETMSDERMMEAARIAQASEFIESKEEGYQTPIAQGGTNVSGGQKQRLSIARAIAKQAQIFIFDDSFSALDFKTDAKLREALDKLIRETGSTVMVVAQRISSIMHAEQIIVLDEGKIVGKGKHKELLKNCDVYREIAYSQLSKEELENE